MKVRDVMTYGVIGVPESTSIAEAVETMLRSRVSALVRLRRRPRAERHLERGRPSSPQRARKQSPSAPIGSSFSLAAAGSPTPTPMSMGPRSAK